MSETYAVPAPATDTLHLHLANSPELLLTLDPQMQRVVHCNAAVAAKLGYSKEELLGMIQLNLYAPCCRARAAEASTRLLSDGRIDDVELQVLCKDGRLLDVSLSAIQIRDAQGTIQYCDAVWQNINHADKTHALSNKHRCILPEKIILAG